MFNLTILKKQRVCQPRHIFYYQDLDSASAEEAWQERQRKVTLDKLEGRIPERRGSIDQSFLDSLRDGLDETIAAGGSIIISDSATLVDEIPGEPKPSKSKKMKRHLSQISLGLQSFGNFLFPPFI